MSFSGLTKARNVKVSLKNFVLSVIVSTMKLSGTLVFDGLAWKKQYIEFYSSTALYKAISNLKMNHKQDSAGC